MGYQKTELFNGGFIELVLKNQTMISVTPQQWISVAAYYQAESRGFAPGRALDDWLAAEREYIKEACQHYVSMAEEDGVMSIDGLRQLAKSIGVVNCDAMNVDTELIQAIQALSHRRTCFRSGDFTSCLSEEDCQWRSECRKLVAEWCR